MRETRQDVSIIGSRRNLLCVGDAEWKDTIAVLAILWWIRNSLTVDEKLNVGRIVLLSLTFWKLWL